MSTISPTSSTELLYHEQESPTHPGSSCISWMKIKFSSMFTKKFLLIFLFGQFLSFCITSTIVATAELKINAPTTQNIITYFVLFVTCTPITIMKYGLAGFLKMMKIRAWKYILIAFMNVQGNYLIVKAFEYTSPLSLMLLDAWTTPIVAILSFVFLKTRFRLSQYFGIIICMTGFGIVILGDFDVGKDMDHAKDPIKGDMFAIVAATCYGISNVFEELCVKERPLHEVIGQMGFWGTIISCIQIVIMERDEFDNLVLSPRMTFCSTILGLIIYYIDPEDNSQENNNEIVDNIKHNDINSMNDLENNINMEFINKINEINSL
ncbi:22576_t:CDS:2 [Cetraspora pellucida]|uniref:22576_t:CDS:1 n=1 Tax=Cetraspora pellucida TaxID=1433469 RepID=A0A9N9BI31_9GLOM|nr:22576_t:CDS:2 [Cetraspora pellucida]